MAKPGSLKDKASVFEGNAKPSVEEMLAAMLGITSAGVTFVLRGVGVGQELSALAVEAAHKSTNIRHALMQGTYNTDEAVAKLLEFLEGKKTVLRKYKNVELSHPDPGSLKGGTVRDVIYHIYDILRREQAGTQARPEPRFNAVGALEKPFHAFYLPKYEAAKSKAKASPKDAGVGVKPRPHRLKREEAQSVASPS